MAQGPSDTILVAIRITPRIRESKVRNPDHPDRRRFVLCECILVRNRTSVLAASTSDRLTHPGRLAVHHLHVQTEKFQPVPVFAPQCRSFFVITDACL